MGEHDVYVYDNDFAMRGSCGFFSDFFVRNTTGMMGCSIFSLRPCICYRLRTQHVETARVGRQTPLPFMLDAYFGSERDFTFGDS